MLDAAKYLEKYFGYELDFIPVDREGRVNPEDVTRMIKENTVFVSVMFGNNEVGTIEPITEIGRALAIIKKERLEAGHNTPLILSLIHI